MSGPERERWERYKAEIKQRLEYSAVYGSIQGRKPSGDGCFIGLCPFHDDHNPSFGFRTDTGTWECFAGCGKGDVFAFLARLEGRPFKDVLLELGDRHGVPRPGNGDAGAPHVIYDYCDATGTLLFQVLRGPGKKFWQRRPDGQGGWIKNLQGVSRVLYRLPEVLARADETVLVVEGEKDADRLVELGLLATTNSGGAGKWRASHSESLRGRDVVVLPDNDGPGREHAAKVVQFLRGVAAMVRVVELPDLQPKGDVSDWLDAGHTRQELESRIAEIEPIAVSAGNLPHILINHRQLSVVITEAWSALLAVNDPPRLFTATGGLARIVFDDGVPRIELIDEATAYGLLLRTASWHSDHESGERDAKPPKEVARDLLAFQPDDLPRLEAVVTTPVFDSQGTLLSTPGYHPDSRLWLNLDDQLTLAPVPVCPSDAELRCALALIREHLLVDFPFAAESDKAHALASLLLPFVRRMIDGPTPIHLIEAPAPGSGKSLLADLVSIVTTGRASDATTVTRNEDEARKKLTAILSRGRPVVLIDNVQGGLESAQLSSAITAETWSDRILGKTQMVEFPNRALWMVTGNNPKLTMEIARRCVRIRLVPAEERPWERVGFKHAPIRTWTRECRPGLVWAALVVIQAWIAAGRPPGTKTLGSFENWATVIGGILRHADVHGFLEDTEEFYEAADSETGEWKALVTAWHDQFGAAAVTSTQLLALSEEGQYVPYARTGNSESARLARFGKLLGGLRNRKFGDLQVIATLNKRRGSNDYRLVQVARELFDAKDGA